MKSVLITGVAGFIGSNLAQKFHEEGFNVIGVDDLSMGDKSKKIINDINFIETDLSDENNFNLLPKKIDTILHLAGQSSGEISFDNPVKDLERNTVSTINLIKYGIEKSASKFLYASSMSVYGNTGDYAVKENNVCEPLSCYGVGKLASENYLRIYSKYLPYVSLRMFNVYGPGQDMNNLRQGMLSIFLAQLISNNQIEIKGSLKRFRDFVHVKDVVDVWWEIANNEEIKNEIFNLGTGIKTTVKELLDIMLNYFPKGKYLEVNGTPGDQNGIYADISKLKRLINKRQFISLQDGIGELINFFN